MQEIDAEDDRAGQQVGDEQSVKIGQNEVGKSGEIIVDFAHLVVNSHVRLRLKERVALHAGVHAFHQTGLAIPDRTGIRGVESMKGE